MRRLALYVKEQIAIWVLHYAAFRVLIPRLICHGLVWLGLIRLLQKDPYLNRHIV